MYNSCAYVDHANVPWCSTRVDTSGVHVQEMSADGVDINHQDCLYDVGYDLSIYDNFTCACSAGAYSVSSTGGGRLPSRVVVDHVRRY